MKKIWLGFIISICIIVLSAPMLAQPAKPDETESFFFDAVVFKADSLTDARLDVFVLIPYKSLQFSKTAKGYSSQYTLSLKIIDSLGNKIDEKNFNRKINETDLPAALGVNAKFEPIQNSFNINAGEYLVKAIFIDNNSNTEIIKSRKITVLKFGNYPFSLSGVMLISSIEEASDGFKITPHVSDNVGMLTEGFFVFFEAYNNKISDSTDFIYEWLNSSEKSIFKSNKILRSTLNSRNQLYLKIIKPANLGYGSYILQILASTHSDTGQSLKENYIAIARRSLKYYPSQGGYDVKDLDKAVRQLIYVADNTNYEWISSATEPDEKQKRFDSFWRTLDPSPNTELNEAYEEFYSRVEYANKNFKSYNEGWRTDKGMVFIIYGQPMRTERYSPYNDGRLYERWFYADSREIIFGDNSGFGDFRLVRPIAITDKYKYSK